MRVGNRLAEVLIENGVEYVFGVPGGQTLPLYEGISKFQGRIEQVLMRDERSKDRKNKASIAMFQLLSTNDI